METKMVDITLHLAESTSRPDREILRDRMLAQKGVLAATYHDEKPHLMIIEYDPDVISSNTFVEIAEDSGVHASIVGL